MRKHIRKLRDSNEMVSNIVGTIVLLGIIIVIFSSLYGMVLSHPFSVDSSTVTVIGTIEGDTIIFEHRGGKALSPETIISITISGIEDTSTVQELLIDDNNDGLWNIGERLVYKFGYNLDLLDADVIGIDVENNKLVIIGTIDIKPESDIGVKITVDDKNPIGGSETTLRIKATNYRGNTNASNIIIHCKLPNELIYIKHDTSEGVYDRVTGIWHINDWLDISQSATLNITVRVTYANELILTTYVKILDSTPFDPNPSNNEASETIIKP